MERKPFSIDINLTRDCNLDCVYCFEEKKKEYLEDVDGVLEFLDKLLCSAHFTNNYNLLSIGFWGGEPTTRPNTIEKIVKYYIGNPNVRFFIYSNGFNIHRRTYDLLNVLKRNMVDDKPKLCIQVSYDGYELHNRNRLTKQGTSSVEQVRSTIKKLDYDRIPYVVKSVIRPIDFSYMHHAYKDIRHLIYEDAYHNDFFKSKNYFPTIEYYSAMDYTEEEIDSCIINLKESLKNIVVDDIKFTKKHGFGFFSWFGKNRAICIAGKDMVAIDLDGTIYKCHGCLYDCNMKDHIIGHLKDINIIDKINESRELHKGNFDQSTCDGCNTNICLRCNTVKYEHSKKKDYMERFTDYTNQPILCEFYREANKYRNVFHSILRRK
jgi:uncharacterized protein